MEKFVADLSDYPSEIVKNFFKYLSDETSVVWNSGHAPDLENFGSSKFLFHETNGRLTRGCAFEDDYKVLTRNQFIDKMKEIHPKKSFNIGDWVTAPSFIDRGKGQIRIIEGRSHTVYFPDWNRGHSGDIAEGGNHCWFFHSEDLEHTDPPKTKELTVSEISKLLGYEVKVVKE